jgi:hypothetical protein
MKQAPAPSRWHRSRVGHNHSRHLGGAGRVGAAELTQQVGLRDDPDQSAAFDDRQRSDLSLEWILWIVFSSTRTGGTATGMPSVASWKNGIFELRIGLVARRERPSP